MPSDILKRFASGHAGTFLAEAPLGVETLQRKGVNLDTKLGSMALPAGTELKRPDAIWIDLTPNQVTSTLEQQGVASETWPRRAANVLEARKRLEPRIQTADFLSPIIQRADEHRIIEDKSDELHPENDGYHALGQILTYGTLFRDDFGFDAGMVVLAPSFTEQFEMVCDFAGIDYRRT